MSQVGPMVPVQVKAATVCTSTPTMLFAVSFVKTAVTPAGNDGKAKAPKPAPPIEPLYLINGTSPSVGTPVTRLSVTVPEVVRFVAVITALAPLKFPN